MKNYGDRGECYRPRRITPSEISIILHKIQRPNLRIVLLFIQNDFCVKNIAKTCLPPSMLSSSSIVHVQGCSAPQILSKQQMSPFALSLFLPCFQLLFLLVLTLETSEMFAIYVATTKTTQPRPQVFSVNGALTRKKAALLVSSVH